MTLADEYLRKSFGNRDEAMRLMAADLMADDPAVFKRGYTRENAVIATAEVFGCDRSLVEEAVPHG